MPRGGRPWVVSLVLAVVAFLTAQPGQLAHNWMDALLHPALRTAHKKVGCGVRASSQSSFIILLH